MTVTVYIDVLLCVNLIINYFILSACFKYIKCNIKASALLRGSIAGAVFSLVILLPELPLWLDIPLRLLIAGVVVFSASLKKPLKIFLRLYAVFFLMTFALSGIIYFMYMTLLPGLFYTRNGIVYADISPLMLIGISSVCYAILRMIDDLLSRHSSNSFFCKIRFTYKGEKITAFSKLDTGNSLKEPFSGAPVIIVNPSVLSSVKPPNEEDINMRLIPFSSIGGSGMLYAVKAEDLNINGNEVLCDVYIAFCSSGIKTSGIEALISTELSDYITTTPKNNIRSDLYETCIETKADNSKHDDAHKILR